MSCCADVRICSKDTKLAVKEVDIGIAADIGTLSRLPKVVSNISWVKDIALSARIFGAEEALGAGFVSHVYGSKAESITAAVSWATLVASKSPVAVQGTKELINHARDHSVADSKDPLCHHSQIHAYIDDRPALHSHLELGDAPNRRCEVGSAIRNQ